MTGQEWLVRETAAGCGVVGAVGFLFSEIEQGRLGCGVFTEFSHLIDTAGLRFFLFALRPALRFVSLSLLTCLFFLALCEC